MGLRSTGDDYRRMDGLSLEVDGHDDANRFLKERRIPLDVAVNLGVKSYADLVGRGPTLMMPYVDTCGDDGALRPISMHHILLTPTKKDGPEYTFGSKGYGFTTTALYGAHKELDPLIITPTALDSLALAVGGLASVAVYDTRLPECVSALVKKAARVFFAFDDTRYDQSNLLLQEVWKLRPGGSVTDLVFDSHDIGIGAHNWSEALVHVGPDRFRAACQALARQSRFSAATLIVQPTSMATYSTPPVRQAPPPSQPPRALSVLKGHKARLGSRTRSFISQGAPKGDQKLAALRAARDLWKCKFSEANAVECIWEGLQLSMKPGNFDPKKPWQLKHAKALVHEVYTKPWPKLGVSRPPKQEEPSQAVQVDSTEAAAQQEALGQRLDQLQGAMWAWRNAELAKIKATDAEAVERTVAGPTTQAFLLGLRQGNWLTEYEAAIPTSPPSEIGRK